MMQKIEINYDFEKTINYPKIKNKYIFKMYIFIDRLKILPNTP